MGKRLKIKTSITLEPEQLEFIKARAKEIGVSDVSTFIRMMIVEYQAALNLISREM